MELLKQYINIIGTRNVIIMGIILLIIIIGIIVYRLMKLRAYRKQLVDLENEMNAVKSLPIQYRLGRVKGISRNMPEIKEQYDDYSQQYEKISELQSDEIIPLINAIDEKLYYRKIRGIKKELVDLTNKINQYETDSQELLKKIEVITEIENVQRLEIIKVKEKYRNTTDTYAHIRFKVEDYVPKIVNYITDIDERFVELETLMNNQDYEEAKRFTDEISSDVDVLDGYLKNLPTYISVVRQYLPDRIKETKEIMNEMKDNGFAIERLNSTMRINKVDSDLADAIAKIKDVDLDDVDHLIEVITEDINLLKTDYEKEKVAFNQYAESKKSCYKNVKRIDKGLLEAKQDIKDIQENYILDEFEITINEDYDNFEKILDELAEINDIIETNDFSYSEMIERFDEINKECQPFNDSLIKHNQLAQSLRIQEKRALDELDNINIVLLEIKSEIRNKHLPMISDSYQDYIEDSYQKADAILNFIKQRPIDLKSLSTQVDAARDVIYKLYDNIHNLIVTADMVEDAIIYGNRYRSSFLEVNTELTKAELLYRNGEYTKALSTAVDIIEKIKPDSYEMLVDKKSPKDK